MQCGLLPLSQCRAVQAAASGALRDIGIVYRLVWCLAAAVRPAFQAVRYTDYSREVGISPLIGPKSRSGKFHRNPSRQTRLRPPSWPRTGLRDHSREVRVTSIGCNAPDSVMHRRIPSESSRFGSYACPSTFIGRLSNYAITPFMNGEKTRTIAWTSFEKESLVSLVV